MQEEYGAHESSSQVACALGGMFFSRFALSWVMPKRVANLCTCWRMSGSFQNVVVWKMLHFCLLWGLWRERNNRCFEDHEKDVGGAYVFIF